VIYEPLMAELQQPPSHTNAFRKAWASSTADGNLTLHGFRRFKTTHLLNLRLLENEIAEMDHTVYQAGLSLDLSPSPADRLGLKHSIRDASTPKVEEVITPEFITKLRDLIKQYGSCQPLLSKENRLRDRQTTRSLPSITS
jgi:hypothetical protein